MLARRGVFSSAASCIALAPPCLCQNCDPDPLLAELGLAKARDLGRPCCPTCGQAALVNCADCDPHDADCRLQRQMCELQNAMALEAYEDCTRKHRMCR